MMATKLVCPFRFAVRRLMNLNCYEHQQTRLCSSSFNTLHPLIRPKYSKSSQRHQHNIRKSGAELSNNENGQIYINNKDKPNDSTNHSVNSSNMESGDKITNKECVITPSNDFFNRVISRFPGDGDGENLCFSFAYGSGVFKQVGHSSPKGNMTDFILAVNDPLEWHRQNMERNPSDYAGLMRLLGATLVTEIQVRWGGRLYFNTLIPFEDGRIKYGVISRTDLIADLLDWDSLYSAGRLQKPVRILGSPSKLHDPELHLALRMNLASSVHTALLLLPDRFSEEKLYYTIAKLSYVGDFRMAIGGEDRNKVANIVQPLIPKFRDLYSKQLEKISQFVNFSPGLSQVEQDVSPAGRHHHLTMLPQNLQGWLVSVWNEDGRYRDVEDVLRAAAFERDSGDVLKTCLQRIVWGPSITQAAKGILSAGTSKSFRYGFAKLQKGIKSLKNKREREFYEEMEKEKRS